MPQKPVELAYHQTPLGELILRSRPEPLLEGRDVYEVKLGDEYLMSSLFVEGERELANIGLAGLGPELSVVVGGLGLGYTAAAALEHTNVAELLVIDLFPEVISWHEQGLVPLGKTLTEDTRCEFVCGDFFEMANRGFHPSDQTRKFDAVLLDIDHSPEFFLDPRNEAFYTQQGLGALSVQLKPHGVFALWSTELPDDDFTEKLSSVFGDAKGHIVEFPNPYNGTAAANGVYVARCVS
ncbi:MAG: spermidine synthase [Pyrinomonadaceae bacterium]